MPSSNDGPTLRTTQANQEPAVTGDKLEIFGVPDLAAQDKALHEMPGNFRHFTK